MGLAVLLGLLLGWGAVAQAQPPSQWVERHTALGRAVTRLREATAAGERASLAERLPRLGPPEPVALALAEALATELEPPVRRALLMSATRVAALDPSAARILGPIAIQRFSEASTTEERAAWARLLGWIATPDAVAALMPRVHEIAVADALVHARATEALIAALEGGDRAHVVHLLGRIGDPRATEPLFSIASNDDDGGVLDALARIASASDDAAAIARVRATIEGALDGTEDARRLVALLDALARLGVDARRSEPVARRLSDPEPSVASAALRCAHAIEPAWAASFAATLASDDPRVASLLAVSDEPALVPHASALASVSAMREPALDFLSRARGGAGIDALFSSDAPALVIAVALRRAHVAHEPRIATFGSALRALAGQDVVFDPEGDVRARAASSMALALAPSPPVGPLADWIAAEPDRAVRAWLLEAARRHRVALDARWLRRTLDDDAEPALILAVPLAAGASSDRRALRRQLSFWLRTGEPPQVAAAITSLSVMGAREAAAAIEALLEHPQSVVRIAAGRALLELAPERARYVRARGAIDSDPRVARLLGASPDASSERDVLFLDVTTTETVAPWIEVQTDDGLLRRLPVAADGTFALPDVAGASAEVRLLLPE